MAQSRERRRRSRSYRARSNHRTCYRVDNYSYRRRSRSRDRNERNKRSSSRRPRYSSRQRNRDWSRSRHRSYSDESYSSSNSSSEDDDERHFEFSSRNSRVGQYSIIKELGKGTFGKVFLCSNREQSTEEMAMKIIRGISRYVSSAKIEADILRKVTVAQQSKNVSYCVKMFDQFHYHEHYCMVFERLGMSFLDVISGNKYVGFPLYVVQCLMKQLLECLEFLHSIRLVHTDLKLENVLFQDSSTIVSISSTCNNQNSIFVPENLKIKLIDFGGATFDDDEDRTTIINTRQYRSPEVILEAKNPSWSYASDMWSIACIVAEIYDGELLFRAHDDLVHLSMIEKICGEFSQPFLDRCRKKRDYFHRDGRLRVEDIKSRSNRKRIEGTKFLEKCFSRCEGDETSGIVDLCRQMLAIDPEQRIAPSKALQHSFFNVMSSEIQYQQSSDSYRLNGKREYPLPSNDSQHRY